jgi:type IV secretory pathway VirB10-like protein
VASVSVNKGFLVGVVAVAGAALLALAYQLGKASAPEGAPAPPTRIERIAPRPKDEPLPQPARVAAATTDYGDTRAVSAPTPSAPEQPAVPQAAAGQAPAPIDGERGGGGDISMRAAVAAYFFAVERIQVGSMTGNAESVGQEMAAALANGDTSSLEKMIRETEAARVRLAGVAAPAPCAAHHRESLRSLDDALEVLRSLKTAMESPEPIGQLANVTTRAQALRSRADVLQKEERALKERYGLNR